MPIKWPPSAPTSTTPSINSDDPPSRKTEAGRQELLKASLPMTEPTVNIPLLRKAVEWAEAEAAKPIELCEWEQGEYVATKAQQERWRRIYTNKNKPPSRDEWFGRLALKAPECGTCYCIAGYVAAGIHGLTVEPTDVRHEARDALGLSWDQADDLFADENTIADVRRIAESIAGERL